MSLARYLTSQELSRREDGGLHSALDQGARRAGGAGVRRDRDGTRTRRSARRASTKTIGGAVEPGIVSMYQQIAAARQTVPEAIALGMLDRRAEVLKVETDQGTEFVLRGDLDALKKNHTIVSEEVLVPQRLAGQLQRPRGPRVWVREAAGEQRAPSWPADWGCRRRT